MLNAEEIKNIKFSKSMGGYKQEEVDILLDRVEAEYAQFERTIKELQGKIESLENENNELKASQSSIQNVLLSAQKLADRIVNEAKEKSEEIIQNADSNISVISAREKELSATFELKASERKAQLEKELTDMINTANKKAESITAAANDSVARQQMLFDKIKIEIAAFKTAVTAKYKEHLEILNSIPDTVPMNPEKIAEAVSFVADKVPEPEQFLPSVAVFEEQIAPHSTQTVPVKEESTGFVVEDVDFAEDTEQE